MRVKIFPLGRSIISRGSKTISCRSFLEDALLTAAVPDLEAGEPRIDVEADVVEADAVEVGVAVIVAGVDVDAAGFADVDAVAPAVQQTAGVL